MKATLGQLVLNYLRFWARFRLGQTNPTIIGITGSSGKTSALLACQAVLENHTALKVSHKANSESGISLNILNLQPRSFTILDWLRLCIQAPVAALFGNDSYETYLVELGIDGPTAPKNMEYLLSIVKPQVGMYLGTSAVHSENFDHLVPKNATNRLEQITTLIAAEKSKLITSLPKSGTAIINLDDPYSTTIMSQTAATVISFATQAESTIRLTKTNWTEKSTIFAFEIDRKRYQLQLHNHLVPELYGLTLAAAIACGLSQEISITESITALETDLKIPPGRSSILEGSNGSRILDSSYNASTKPMLAMLDLLNTVSAKRKLALLGDMREMGAVTQAEHEKVAESAAKICDRVFLVGPLMQQYARPVLEQKKIPTSIFGTAQEAGQAIKNELQSGDLLLVKGSQNTIFLEAAIEHLLAKPKDASKLCRRGEFWDQKRTELTTDSH